jgi:hypothetical protein
VGNIGLQQGYFSLLRWRSDATRDEARNLAVVLVDAEGTIGGLRHGSIASVSSDLHEQGLLDTLVVGLERRLGGPQRPDLQEIRRLHTSMQQSLYFTEPKPCAVTGVEETLDTLYKAYLARRGFPGGPTKGRLIEKVVRILRHAALNVERDAYVGDYRFDAVVSEGDEATVVTFLTFAQTSRRDWRPAENEAGCFVFSVDKAELPGVAVIEAPTSAGTEASVAYERVRRWFRDANLSVLDPATVVSEPRLLLR